MEKEKDVIPVRYRAIGTTPLCSQTIGVLAQGNRDAMVLPEGEAPLDVRQPGMVILFPVGADQTVNRCLLHFPTGIQERLAFVRGRPAVIPPCALHAWKLIGLRMPRNCDVWIEDAYERLTADLNRLHIRTELELKKWKRQQAEEIRRTSRRTYPRFSNPIARQGW